MESAGGVRCVRVCGQWVQTAHGGVGAPFLGVGEGLQDNSYAIVAFGRGVAVGFERQTGVELR